MYIQLFVLFLVAIWTRWMMRVWNNQPLIEAVTQPSPEEVTSIVVEAFVPPPPVRMERIHFAPLEIGQVVDVKGLGELTLVRVVSEDDSKQVWVVEARKDSEKFLVRVCFTQWSLLREDSFLTAVKGKKGFPAVVVADGGNGLIVMEHSDMSEGDDLRKKKFFRNLAPYAKLSIMRQVVDRIQTVHRQGFVFGPGLTLANWQLIESTELSPLDQAVEKIFTMTSGFHQVMQEGVDLTYPKNLKDMYLCAGKLDTAPRKYHDLVRMVFFLIDALYANLPWNPKQKVPSPDGKGFQNIINVIFNQKRALAQNQAYFTRHHVYRGFAELLQYLYERSPYSPIDYDRIRAFFDEEKFEMYLHPIPEHAEEEEDDYLD